MKANENAALHITARASQRSQKKIVFIATTLVLWLGFCSGCGKLVGLRGVILDEPTRLEREILGERKLVGEGRPLLDLNELRDGLRVSVLHELEAEYAAQQKKLQESGTLKWQIRMWQCVIFHNRGVLTAIRGDREKAEGLIKKALKYCETYAFDTLKWQVLFTLGTLAGGERGYARFLEAENALFESVIATRTDYQVENGEACQQLYRRLISSSLTKNEGENAFRFLLRQHAIELARASAPGSFQFTEKPAVEYTRQLGAARQRFAKARSRLCRYAPDALLAAKDELSDEVKEAHDGLKRARNAVSDLRDNMRKRPAPGSRRSRWNALASSSLIIPVPARAPALQQILWFDSALLCVESIGNRGLAVFVLTREKFHSLQVQLDEKLRNAIENQRYVKETIELFSEKVLGQVKKMLDDPIRRTYLCVGEDLQSLPWRRMQLFEQKLGERMQLCHLGGPADLEIAFHRKSYGREHYLIYGDHKQLASLGIAALDEPAKVLSFEGETVERAELIEEVAFSDFLWFGDRLAFDALRPWESYLNLSNSFGRIDGMGPVTFAGLGTRAGCACFAKVDDWRQDRSERLSLRVLTRAVMAGGVPTLVLVRDGVATDVSRDFWERFLPLLQTKPVGKAFQIAVSHVPDEEKKAFQLRGFSGMGSAEFAQYSKLEFNDTVRRYKDSLDEGELQGAAKELLELVRMAEALNFGSRSRKLKTLANLQQRLVFVWRQMRLYERAAQSQEKRIQYVQQIEAFPGRALAIDYKTLGTLYTEANLYEKSLKAYEKSLELLKKHGKQEDIARTLGELGKSFGYAARYEKSMQTFQKAIANYEQMGDTAGVAAQESQLGSLLLRHMNRPHEAQTHFERARQAYEAVGEIARQAESIMDIALCRRRLGDFEGAAERFKKALSMVREEKSKRQKESDTKTSPDRTRILGRQESRALSELGNTSWLNGKYQKAFQQCYAAREIAQELNDAYRLNVIAQLLGLIHWELNNYKQAHEAITEAIKYAKRAGRPREVVTAYNNRGIIFRRQGEYEEALEAFEKAFKVDRRLRDKWGLGYDHRNIGITLHRLGRLEEAAGHLEKAVRLTAEIGDAINHAKAVYYLGDLQREQGKKSATKYLGMALEEARGVYLPQIEWRALRSLGSLRLEAGEQEKAVKFLKEAVDVVEKMRTGLKVQEFRSGFLQNKMDLYEETVKILLDMGREQEAFAYSERSRSRHFVDILAGKSLELRTAQEKRLYDRQQELGKEIQVLARAARQATTDSEREEAAGLLEKRRSEFKENLVNIRSLNPQLASFVSVEVAEIEALQEVMSEEVLLLVYYLLDDEVVAWVIGRDRFNTRRIPVKRVDLEKQIRSYRVSVQERELLARVKDQSQRLYKKLISPVEEEIVGPNVLCVVPHGALHYVSFASLYNGKEFLVERCPVSYLPSASIFPHSIPAEVPHRVGPDMLRVLAVGDPEVGKPAYRLPFTRQEIKSLKRNFVEVTSLRGEKATESWVTENISDFDVIHFGVHGYFNPLNPLFSALMLAPDAERKQDGELELHEVSGLTIEAQLVALSACQSAVGELKSADELVSLSRAFFYAGTNSILSTLWRVDDVSTSLLAKHFYRYYAGHALEKSAEGGTKAEALRYAQLQVMNDGRHYHPMYWAGMTLSGDYR